MGNATVAPSRLERLLPWIPVILGPLALFGPMLASGETLFWGTPLLQFAPWRAFALETLRSGHLPLWNPWLGMGAPLLANHQSALLYPPTALLGLAGVAWGQGLLVMLHVAWAGAGMILLARRLGLSPISQALAAMAFSLSGGLIARAGFLSMNASAAWIPWIVFSADTLAGSLHPGRSAPGQVRYAAGLALCLALQWLAGHAQTAWYTAVLLVVWMAWRGWGENRSRGAIRGLLWLTGAALLGFSLSACQLLPTLEYVAQSARHIGLDEEFALTYSFWPWRALGLLFPDLFGNPTTGDFWGYGNYWEDALYIGVLPFLLGLSAVVASFGGRGDRVRLGRLLAGIAAAAFILALGKNTPVFPFLFRTIPTFNLFQAPARWNTITIFALSLLAALGAERWGPPEGRRLYWTRLGTVGAATLSLAAWLGGPMVHGVQATFVRAFAVAGAWMLLAGVLSLLRRRGLSAAWTSAVTFVVLADLVHAGTGLNPGGPTALFDQRTATAAQADNGHRLYMSADLAYDLTYGRFFRFQTFDSGLDWGAVREAELPNTSLLEPLPSANNFDPLIPARISIWLEELERVPQEQRERLLDLMDVGWVAVPAAEEAAGVRYQPRGTPRRVWLVDKAEGVPGEESALRAVLEPGFDPGEVVILEGAWEAPSAALGGGGQASLVPQDDPNYVAVEVRTTNGAWLVLSDVWYPGWEATIDGDTTPVLRADYLFRAVRVPAGAHRVEFRYRPTSILVGGVLSLIGLVVLSGAAVWGRRA